jgi:hypothetical protein
MPAENPKKVHFGLEGAASKYTKDSDKSQNTRDAESPHSRNGYRRSVRTLSPGSDLKYVGLPIDIKVASKDSAHS